MSTVIHDFLCSRRVHGRDAAVSGPGGALRAQIDEVVMAEKAVVVSEFGGLVAGKVEVWSWACCWLARNEVVWQLTYPLAEIPTIHGS